MQSGGVESRLVAQMVTMAAPGTIVPSIVVATASLQPWDEGDLLDLERLAEEDLEVRLAAAIPASPPRHPRVTRSVGGGCHDCRWHIKRVHHGGSA